MNEGNPKQPINLNLFNRNFVMVLIGQIISLFGNTILRFALSLYVLDVTGSAAIFGTVMAFAIIPTIILSPFGGMIADRVSRRNIMVILDFITSILVFSFGFTLSEQYAVPLVSVMLILLSIIQAMYNPSVQSSIPLLQAEGNLVKANTLANLVAMLANLVGPVLGGLLYGIFGATPIIFVSAACFFLSALLEIFIHIPFEKRERNTSTFHIVKNDFKESTDFMTKDQPNILKTILIVTGINFFIIPIVSVGMPYMFRTVLGLSSELYGYSGGIMAAGGIAGAIVAGIVANKVKIRNIYILLVAVGICIIPIGLIFLFGSAPIVSYGIITACAMLAQFILTVFSIFTLSIIQAKTPNHLLGKVTSYIMTLTMCAQPIGQAIYGILFDMFSTQLYILLITTAIMVVLVGLLSRNIFIQFDNQDKVLQ